MLRPSKLPAAAHAAIVAQQQLIGYSVYPIYSVRAHDEDVTSFTYDNRTYKTGDEDFLPTRNSLRDHSQWAATPKEHRTYSVIIGSKFGARSDTHGKEADQHLLLPTSTKNHSPAKTDLVIGKLHRNKRGYHLRDWFGIGIEGQRFLEMLNGREDKLPTMMDVLRIEDPNPEIAFFYINRAKLLVFGDISWFVELAMNAHNAGVFGCTNPTAFVASFTVEYGANHLWTEYARAMKRKGRPMNPPKSSRLIQALQMAA